ncbi:MAG: hypothetical protein L6R35_007144 [Caloplaca aegaea]|nr:MAG: hypothetical protein L6R35_007144 [Caloplaca aegaea]
MVIVLPQKFQVVSGDNGFKAGYRLLAITMSFSLGAILSSILTEKKGIPPFLHIHHCELPPGPRSRPHDLPLNHTAESLARAARARTLGGTLGISICTNLLNKHIIEALKKVLSPQQISGLLGSARWIAALPEEVRSVVKRIYAEEYRDQAITLTAC